MALNGVHRGNYHWSPLGLMKLPQHLYGMTHYMQLFSSAIIPIYNKNYLNITLFYNLQPDLLAT